MQQNFFGIVMMLATGACPVANADALLMDMFASNGNGGNPASYTNWVNAGVAEDVSDAAGGSFHAANGNIYNISGGLSYTRSGHTGNYGASTFGDNMMLNDYLYVNQGTVAISISGLENLLTTADGYAEMGGNMFILQPDTDYKLYLFGAGDSDGQDSTFTFGGVQKTTASNIVGTAEDAGHFVTYEFTTPSDVNGYTLDFTYSNYSSDYAAFNGLALVSLAPATIGTNYYINTQDAFEAVTNVVFQPGDKILLERGQEFTGMLSITGSGSAEAPILIDAYGTGDRPVINAMGVNQAGIRLNNPSFIEVQGLEITNTDGTTGEQGDIFGVLAYMDQDIGVFRHIYINDLYIHDVNGQVGEKERGGIHVRFDSEIDNSRVDDLRITNNRLEDIGGVGITFLSNCANVNVSEDGSVFTENLWTRVYVASNELYRIGRNAIIARDSRCAVYEYNTLGDSSLYEHGHSIFTFDSYGTVIQYNEMYGNRGYDEGDRGAAAAGYNCAYTFIQYNYSHDNEWSFAVMNQPSRGVVIRYNISENERSGFYYYGFEGSTNCLDAYIYNNTHYAPAGTANQLIARNRTPVNSIIANNIFYFEDPADVIVGSNEGGINTIFTNNLYHNLSPHPSDGSPIIGDPLCVQPGYSGQDIDLTTRAALRGYQPQPGSPAIDAAVSITDLLQLPMNLHMDQDILGNVIYGDGADLGAIEYNDSNWITFDFLDGSVWDSGTGGGQLGSNLTLTNMATDDAVTMTTVDIIGQDGTRASQGGGHLLNVVSTYLGVDSGNAEADVYEKEWRMFNPNEGWVIIFDEDIYLECIDLDSQNDDAEITLSSTAFDDIILGGGAPSGVHSIGRLIPAGTEITLLMTTATNGVDTGLGIASITVSTVPNLDQNSGVLLVDYALDEASGTVATDSSGNGFDGAVSNAGWVIGVEGTALEFENSRVQLPVAAFDSVSNEVSIALWVYGSSAQPQEDTLFCAENAAGDKILNIHLPWSDSRVYWDAGNSSGYDRIRKTATTDLFKDGWNHWVFTKDAVSGEMHIYVNGGLWHSGGGNTIPMGEVSVAVLGGDPVAFEYSGLVDEVQIYNEALTAADVATLYNNAPLSGSGIYAFAQDIGCPSRSGSVSYSNGIYTVKGGGADIFGEEDQFYYVYNTHSGDGEIVAQVLSVSNTHTWAKGGIMLRESAHFGSKEVAVIMRPDKQVDMQYRDTPDGSSVNFGLEGDTTHAKWIRLVRSGDLFSGYYSIDGTSWTLIGSVTVNMSSDVLEGLAMTSHEAEVLGTAVFNMVPPAPTGLMAESVGADQIDTFWNPAVNASAYNVKRATASGGAFSVVNGQLTATSCSDTGLYAGTNYYYVVCGEYYGVEGDTSAEVSATPSALIDPDAVILSPAGFTDTDFTVAVSNSCLGHNYRVWSTDDLSDPNWQEVTGILPGNGGLLEIDVSVDLGVTNQYFRLETWRQ